MRKVLTMAGIAAALAFAVGLSLPTVVHAAPGDTATTAPAPAAATGTITGKVLGKDGKPASGVTVRAGMRGMRGGRRAGANAAGGAAGGNANGGRRGRGMAGPTATTGDDGTYTLKDVPVGDQVRVIAIQRGDTMMFGTENVAVQADKETKAPDITLQEGRGGRGGRRGGGNGGGGAGDAGNGG